MHPYIRGIYRLRTATATFCVLLRSTRYCTDTALRTRTLFILVVPINTCNNALVSQRSIRQKADWRVGEIQARANVLKDDKRGDAAVVRTLSVIYDVILPGTT